MPAGPTGTGGYSVVKLGIDKQTKEKARRPLPEFGNEGDTDHTLEGAPAALQTYPIRQLGLTDAIQRKRGTRSSVARLL